MQRGASLFAALEHWSEQSRSLEAAIIGVLLKAIPAEEVPKAERSLATALTRAGWHRKRTSHPHEPAPHEPAPEAEYADLDEEALLQSALRLIIRERRPTADILQRACNIDATQAENILNTLEKRGFLGPQPAKGYRAIHFHRGKKTFEPDSAD